jgi:hypothetical protein
LHKNKELLAKVVVDTQVVGDEGYSKAALGALKFTLLLWG